MPEAAKVLELHQKSFSENSGSLISLMHGDASLFTQHGITLSERDVQMLSNADKPQHSSKLNFSV